MSGNWREGSGSGDQDLECICSPGAGVGRGVRGEKDVWEETDVERAAYVARPLGVKRFGAEQRAFVHTVL